MSKVSMHIILAIVWTLYCFLHSVMASSTFKDFAKRGMKIKITRFRLWYNFFAAISFIAIVIYQAAIQSSQLFIPGLFLRSAGVVIGMCGLSVMSVCIVKYFKGLSGLKKATSRLLMINGIHQWIRHPLYLGTFLCIWGAWMAYPLISLFISNCIITIYTLIGIRLEENKMIAEFGEAYKSYQRKVPMLLPWLK